MTGDMPTLCWDCQKADSRFKCPWAGGVPRKDWQAEPTVINPCGINSPTNKPVKSYRVISCPAFVPDERRIDHGY